MGLQGPGIPSRPAIFWLGDPGPLFCTGPRPPHGGAQRSELGEELRFRRWDTSRSVFPCRALPPPQPCLEPPSTCHAGTKSKKPNSNAYELHPTAVARGHRTRHGHLSEISITLLWTEQGKASNRFRMLSQALQECTGSPQTRARWRLAAHMPRAHSGHSVPGADRGSRSGSPSERAGRQQRPARCPPRPRHPGAEAESQAHGVPVRPAITQSGVSLQSSWHGGRRSAHTPQPRAGRVPRGLPATAGGRAPPRAGTGGQRTPRSADPGSPPRRQPRPHPSEARLAPRTPAGAHPAVDAAWNPDDLGWHRMPAPPRSCLRPETQGAPRTAARCVITQPPGSRPQ